MQVQLDYETERTLALFSSRDQADRAVERLRSHCGRDARISETLLGSGIYQVADPSWSDEMRSVGRGALLGIPMGALLGAAIAAALGDGPTAVVAISMAGAANGAVLGGFVGAIARARFDDDVAPTLSVTDGDDLVLVTVETSGCVASATSRVRTDLRQAGALGFLDDSLPETERLLEGHRPLPA